jgi:hypothetical protein
MRVRGDAILGNAPACTASLVFVVPYTTLEDTGDIGFILVRPTEVNYVEI